MKGNSFIGVMVLGILLVGFAGISHAGGMMHKSSGETKAVEQSSRSSAEEFGTWEYWQAQEAGTLPGTGVSPRSSERDEASNSWDGAEAKQQIRPFEYRDIDRGP